MDFIKDNMGTIVVFLIVAAVIALIIFKLIRDRKNGKSSCGCGCESCANSKLCHGYKEKGD